MDILFPSATETDGFASISITLIIMLMKKCLFTILFVSGILISCHKETVYSNIDLESDSSVMDAKIDYCCTDGEMVLGDKIEIPYSIENLKKAFYRLPLETRSSISIENIVTTHYYVRFHPKNEEELSILKNNSNLMLFEFPLDREIIINGTSYHDPSLPDDMPTYQYATIEAGYWENYSRTLPVEYEVLIEAYIPDYYDTEAKSFAFDDGMVELMRKAYEMTGHEYTPETKADPWYPEGTIKAYDNIAGRLVPIPSLRVRGIHLLRTVEALTDINGYYKFPNSFKNKTTMKIVWESDRWDIRDGNVVQAYYNGPKIFRQDWNVDIPDGDSKALRYAAIHRAAYRHYYGNNLFLARPNNSRKEKIGYIHDDIDKGTTNGDYNQQWGSGVWSDIRIAGRNANGWRKPSEIFSTVCHELGHAAHYTNSTSYYKKSETRVLESWARFVQYILTRQEYIELGVEDLLVEKSTIDIDGEKYLMEYPDVQYNFQYMNFSEAGKATGNTAIYTPVFIDLYDDYNQSLYYYNNDPNHYPDDKIKDVEPAVIQLLVFLSVSFDEIKAKLIKDYCKYVNTNNITEENINALFSVY